jgi:glucose/arabinose dehydrogenase
MLTHHAYCSTSLAFIAAWSRKRSTPDYALGGHTASLGLCWLLAGTLPGFPDGMVIRQHGS